MKTIDKPLFTVTRRGQELTVYEEDVDDIMESVMTGCTYWCSQAEPLNGYLGTYASEQISRGGKIRFYLIDEDDTNVPDLDLALFQKGLQEWCDQKSCNYDISDRNNRIDPGKIDSLDADAILQLALFDDIIYG